MKIGTLLITCLKALVRNPMRAALTVLGIVIGIAAVVAIMEIGEGSKKQVADKFSSMGTNVVTVSGASVITGGSVGASVGIMTGASVGGSVGASVGASVGTSVGSSVGSTGW